MQNLWGWFRNHFSTNGKKKSTKNSRRYVENAQIMNQECANQSIKVFQYIKLITNLRLFLCVCVLNPMLSWWFCQLEIVRPQSAWCCWSWECYWQYRWNQSSLNSNLENAGWKKKVRNYKTFCIFEAKRHDAILSISLCFFVLVFELL